MTRPPSKTQSPPVAAGGGTSGAIDTFLEAARQTPGPPTGRIVFALDATMSRQPSWDAAVSVQGAMFEAASAQGGLSVQLAYFRGLGECQASRWVRDPLALRALMTRISCRGGHTQIARILDHVRSQARETPIGALIYVGDAVEEPVDPLCAIAGEIGLLGTKTFMFQEGADPAARIAFAEIARLSGGAHLPFDSGAPARLAELLRAIAAYASGGAAALRLMADREAGARRLLSAIGGAR